MPHIGTQIIKQQATDIEFLSNEESKINYLYKNKKLNCLMYFEQNHTIKIGKDKAKIPFDIVEKAKMIAAKKGIAAYYVFVNLKTNKLIILQIAKPDGTIPFEFKLSNRNGKPVNYLTSLDGNPYVSVRQCSSTLEN